jgi:phenylacetic acid degradation operon negative regulatory protein
MTADRVDGPAAQPAAALVTVSTRSQLLTVLGEYVMPRQEPVWTASLLYVLRELGAEEKTARQAIMRAGAAGWIEAERLRRETRWRLTPAGRDLLESGERRVYSLADDNQAWDGRWLMLFVTLPGDRSVARRKLYGRLSWAGFGNLFPGLWLTPHAARESEARSIISELALTGQALAVVGTLAQLGLDGREIVARSWNLGQVAAQYQAMLDRFAALRPQAGDDALLTQVRLVSEWLQTPLMDPHLPAQLLPEDWIGHRAGRTFRELRSRWNDAAQARWEQVVRQTSRGTGS